MEIEHVNVKMFLDGDLKIDPSRFIDVFHLWIQEHALPELLIDVADYSHVPAGPGVLLVAHEADYAMDQSDNRWGMRYNRKAAVTGTNADRFRQALGATARACRLLENHFQNTDPLAFSRCEVELFVNDRALAPNTAETFATLAPQIERFFQDTLGHSQFTMTRNEDGRKRFGVIARTARPFDLDALARLPGT